MKYKFGLGCKTFFFKNIFLDVIWNLYLLAITLLSFFHPMAGEDVSVGVEKGSLSILRVVGELERKSVNKIEAIKDKKTLTIDMDTA